jgi:hypothetical protein
MQEIKSAKRAILLPLAGLTIAWLLAVFAAYTDVLVQAANFNPDGSYEQEVRASIYLIFLAITAVAVLSLFGQRIALKLRIENDFLLARAAHRFANLAIILSLLAGAIFAIGNFLGAFGDFNRDASAVVRIFGVYVPIVLTTALVVTILLFGFVFRKDAPDLKHEQDEDRVKKQRAVGLAYASPIIGTAFAIIFGLVVYDVTRTSLDVWIWVIIQLIIATSILIGTRFAAQAKLAAPEMPKPRRQGVAAVNLNFVLSILFGVVVTTMAFSYAVTAVGELIDWNSYYENQPPLEDGKQQVFTPPPLLSPDLGWWLSKMLPSIVLLALAEIGIYKSLVSRNQEQK